jgi:enoyl-CoA hydratase/carnithine racemase
MTASAADAPLLLIETRGAVRLLLLNRPDKLNAMSMALTEQLTDALKAADADEAIGAIVVAGAGKSFSAGADIAEFKDLLPEKQHLVARRAELTSGLQSLLPGLSKPVIAATQGHVLGGGCGLALACDMVVAATSSKFGYPEVRRGILGASVTPNLARQVGTKAAFELLITGNPVDAVRARELGLVNRIVEDGEQVDVAVALAAALAALPAPVLRATKALFYRTLDLDFPAALQAAHDAHRAMRAFPKQASNERFSK